MSERIKILQTIRQGKIGGGERHVIDLVETLDKSVFEPIVLSFTDGEMISHLKKIGIEVHVIHTEKGFDYKGLAEFIDKAENTEKYISLAYNQGRAEMLEEKIANDNNEQFSRTPKRSDSSEVKTVDDLIEFV